MWKLVYVIGGIILLNVASTSPQAVISFLISFLIIKFIISKYPKPRNKGSSAHIKVVPAKVIPFNPSAVTPRVANVPKFIFPEVDDQGMKAVRLIDNVKLSGVTKYYEGVNPQQTIESLSVGEEVFLKRISMVNYPFATLAIDGKSAPIGWIPEDTWYQRYIAETLDGRATIKARVSKILGGDYGKYYGIILDIECYEKKRAPSVKKGTTKPGS